MNVGPPRVPDWKKALFLAVIVVAVFGSVYLLVFENQRQALVMLAARGLDLYRSSEEQVFKLGAPPPKAVEPQTRVQGPSTFSDEGLEGVLYGDIEVEGEEGGKGRDEEEPEFIKPARTEGAEKAYDFLSGSSEVVGQLIRGELEGYTFTDWNPLQNDPPRFILDLAAVKQEDGQEVHLVFEVDLESESFRPLSQAARDLSR